MEGKGVIKALLALILACSFAAALTEAAYRPAGCLAHGQQEGPETVRHLEALPGQGATIKGSIKLEELAGAKDDDHAFEDISGHLTYHIEPLRQGARVEGEGKQGPRFAWELTLSWDKGSFLYYPWFLSLQEIPGTIEARGMFGEKALMVEEAHLASALLQAEAQGISIPLEGNLEGGPGAVFAQDGYVRARGELGRLFNTFVRDAFSFEHPAIGRLSARGGLLVEADSKAAHLSVSGDIDIDGATLIGSLALELSYPLSGATGGQGTCLPGHVSWAELHMEHLAALASEDAGQIHAQAAKIQVDKRDIPMVLCQDSIKAGPAALLFPRGRLGIEEVAYFFGQHPNKAQEATFTIKALTMEDIALKELFSSLPWQIVLHSPGLDGRLVGARIEFSGFVELRMAGGTVRFTNIWLEPFGVIPRYGADIKFSRIDLEQLTSPTSFGRVTGWIKGEIKGLVMSGVQPEAFEMVIENDPDYHGPQKISIKAIENLAILGGSGGGVPLLGTFFKDFSYSRIGISCRLSNDVFELHGLTRKGGVEYLVERGFFGGVNVVNMNPDGKILFADMVERLKRITSTEFEKMEVQ
jgi:hypothetical protein